MDQITTKPGNRALRQGRFSRSGTRYLVTLVTHQRRRIFEQLSCARIVVRAIQHNHSRGLVDSACFVLMPDHLHWLFVLGEGKSLSDLVRDFKGFTARSINRIRFDRTGAVWQPGFHDRALRENEDTRRVSRYISQNPLRARLVESLRDYPHWDTWWFQPDRTTPLESALFGL